MSNMWNVWTLVHGWPLFQSSKASYVSFCNCTFVLIIQIAFAVLLMALYPLLMKTKKMLHAVWTFSQLMR